MHTFETCTQIFIVDLFKVAPKWKHPQFPSKDKWILKNVLYPHDRILFGNTKELSTDTYHNLDEP